MDHEPCLLAASNIGLLESGQYSDLTVRCGGNEYLLHRAIVCPRSDFLTIACDGRFKEGATGIINLPDDDPPTFARLVSYLYTLTYNDKSLEKAQPNDPLAKASANALVYAIADKYNIPSLSTLAATKFRPLIPELWDEDLLAVLGIIITTTPSSRKDLRCLVFTECVKRMPTLVKNEALIRLLDEHAEIGSALAVEGFETMRAEADGVRDRLNEAEKTVRSQCAELKAARKMGAELQAEVRRVKRELWTPDRG